MYTEVSRLLETMIQGFVEILGEFHPMMYFVEDNTV